MKAGLFYANAFVVFMFVQIVLGRDYPPKKTLPPPLHTTTWETHQTGPAVLVCGLERSKIIEFERFDVTRGRILQFYTRVFLIHPNMKFFQSL